MGGGRHGGPLVLVGPPPEARPLFLQFTNRCLLKWLKLWDPVVFGQDRPTRKPRPSVEPACGGKEATASSKWKSHEQVLEEMLEAELDPSGRPRQKVSCAPQVAGASAASGGPEARWLLLLLRAGWCQASGEVSAARRALRLPFNTRASGGILLVDYVRSGCVLVGSRCPVLHPRFSLALGHPWAGARSPLVTRVRGPP